MDIIEIPITLIDEDTDQPRYQFDEEALQELMKSIEEIGLLSPIKVRTTANNRYKIIYGNRRYKASKMLGKVTMSCIVSNVTDEMEIYLEQIAENLTREGFSPIEEAEAFHKLMNDAKFSSSIKYLSSKLGKPESYIKNKCDLLKFGNAVKKLIVSGTEIRKDKLTEDQLLPIKDLAIEHRDPLALIIARDEMPVSDVKKIAKMFKDKDISESTKGKLLYKSGHELVETWSVFQNNRAERAKPAPAKAQAKAQKAEKASTAIETPLAEQSGHLPSSQSQRVETAAMDMEMAVAPIQMKLQQLLSVVQAPTESDLQSDASKLDASEKDKFLSDVDTLVEHLEKQLSQWKKVKELAFSK
ncbi:ParB/RepB/Spo0J family partition protein [Paenibacillus sp. CGMCC 1.16610]|uniref:ParB/RepB/Spo0J family partition protein n=1 Tax=Paenibacillus anseongense TaxID=2682845 RepID=A0ABW9UMM1_9BACL|nr:MULTISPECIES: ParB/RepB/Spo0J family partition protein [Paenibacillus]MBA2943466.1 ParB/RepB/Spo0J family partition protein [Paenibacillus sp. CGMCC 1.16610]MVQ40445.1 ParB/RepB/Spo0J family partition protein [Paenibacillus anseongense]